MKDYMSDFEIPQQDSYCDKCGTTTYIYTDMTPPYKCDFCGEELPQIEKDTPPLKRMIEKWDNDPTTPEKYKVLSELAQYVEHSVNNGNEDNEMVLGYYIFIGDGYYNLGHYLYAMKYYEKAMEQMYILSSRYMDCELEKATEEDIERLFANLLITYKTMKKRRKATKLIEYIDDLVYDEVATAIKKRADKKPHIKRDPVEYTKKYLEILPELEAKIEEELKDVKRGMGYCFEYWHTKQRILEEDYGIEWKSPSVLNPRIKFD